MNFTEAKAKLAEIAAGRYHTIIFEITDNGSVIKPTCSIYIDGLNHRFSGATWELAFEQMAISEMTEEEIYKLAA